ncbi:MAG: helix-turn-helix domain-containing protein [Eggerthellaceae bacterium]|nr:helix-turn-helix domain-containing protein [Eggerthellaceae bacterium]
MAPKSGRESAIEQDHVNASAALDALVANIKSNVNLDGALHPALDKLAEYDRANSSDFLLTLKVYLENDCNAQKCGRILFLHRNSLVYRIRRIQEIAGCDLSDPAERAYLRLSLLLR